MTGNRFTDAGILYEHGQVHHILSWQEYEAVDRWGAHSLRTDRRLSKRRIRLVWNGKGRTEEARPDHEQLQDFVARLNGERIHLYRPQGNHSYATECGMTGALCNYSATQFQAMYEQIPSSCCPECVNAMNP